MIWLVIVATIISITLGGLFAIKFSDKLHLILGFGAGAILGVALFDLLPEAVELTKGSYSLQTMALLIAVGFAFYLILDRFFALHNHCVGDCDKGVFSTRFGAVAIILHSFLDGFSIGLAFKISPAVGVAVALAVAIHGFSDGVNTVNMIIKSHGNRRTALKYLFVAAFAPAIGIAAAYLLVIPISTLGLILSVFVGLFLYISVGELIPESHHRHPTVWTTVMTIVGMLAIYIASNLII